MTTLHDAQAEVEPVKKVNTRARKPMDQKKRILRSVDVDEKGCWNWRLWRNNGYGRLTVQPLASLGTNDTRRTVFAHRYAWELWRGVIPDGLFVLHRCDNPACCNPDHLFLGTQRDNIVDMVAKGRGVSGKGSRHTRKRIYRDNRHKVYLELDGERLSISGWANRAGLPYDTFRRRICSGLTLAEAIARPLRICRSTQKENP